MKGFLTWTLLCLLYFNQTHAQKYPTDGQKNGRHGKYEEPGSFWGQPIYSVFNNITSTETFIAKLEDIRNKIKSAGGYAGYTEFNTLYNTLIWSGRSYISSCGDV